MKKGNIKFIALAVSVLVLSMAMVTGCKDPDEDAVAAVEQAEEQAEENVPVIVVQPLKEDTPDAGEAEDVGANVIQFEDEANGTGEDPAGTGEREAGIDSAAEQGTASGAASGAASGSASGSAEVAEIAADISASDGMAGGADSSAASVTATGNAVSLPNGTPVMLNPSWLYANYSKINSGAAVYYAAPANRKGIVVGVNAGHGTKGGGSVKTYCHPDMTPKVTGGSTAAGSIEAISVSSGMAFNSGESEASANLRLARFLRDELLARGYDVLMIRDNEDVQLDNIARTVICNNMANCHIAIHFDGDGTGSDKGCFYSSVPDALKYLENVAATWQLSEALGDQIMTALSNHGHKLYHGGSSDIDLTQTSYSTVPSVDVEYGNQCSDTSDANLKDLAMATADGVEYFFQMINL